MENAPLLPAGTDIIIYAIFGIPIAAVIIAAVLAGAVWIYRFLRAYFAPRD